MSGKTELAKVAVPHCPLCRGSERHYLYAVREHEYDNTTDESFALYRCSTCQLAYLDPRPAESELGRIYPSNYYSQSNKYSSPDQLDLSTLAGRALHNRLLGRVMGNLRTHMSLDSSHKFLDVGCGGGKALGSLHQEFGCHCVGVDIGIVPEVLNKFQTGPIVLKSGDFLTMDFGGEKFDVVYASHLIEHLADPRSFLVKASSLLKPGGLCVIETPNIDCVSAKFWGPYWGGNHAPRHWFLMNPFNAKEVLKYIPEAKLEVAGIRFVHNSPFWIWSFHSFLKQKIGRKWADRLFPSDEKIIATDILNLIRHTIFTVVDILVLKLTGKTANMHVTYRKIS